MTLNQLPLQLREAFKNGEVEVKVISVLTIDFESKLADALGKGWSAVSVTSEGGRSQGLLVRSTENKTEE